MYRHFWFILIYHKPHFVTIRCSFLYFLQCVVLGVNRRLYSVSWVLCSHWFVISSHPQERDYDEWKAHFLSAVPVLLRSLRLRRRCWGRSESWRKHGRSWLRSDSSSTSFCPASWGRTRADWLSRWDVRRADETLLSWGDVADVRLAALLSYKRGIYSTWNRPVWWEKQVPVLCSVFVCVYVRVYVFVSEWHWHSVWRRLLQVRQYDKGVW